MEEWARGGGGALAPGGAVALKPSRAIGIRLPSYGPIPPDQPLIFFFTFSRVRMSDVRIKISGKSETRELEKVIS